ncbi:MAG: ATP-binding protein [Lachnospiraceae bacterium]|nr:ATP-binding protein [Lachnospiraceae bacterium]
MKEASAVSRFILTGLALVFAMFVLLNTLGLNFMQKQLVSNREDQLYSEANKIIKEYVSVYYQKEMTAVKLAEKIELTGEINGTRIWIINSDGVISMDSEGKAGQCNIAQLYDGFLDHSSIANFMIPGLVSEPVLCVTVVFDINFTKRGYVSTMVPMSAIQEEAVYYSNFVNICYLCFIPILMIALFVLYWRTITPIKRLSKATRDYSKENFRGDFNLSYPKELSELGGTIKYMGDRLKGNEETQRKFLSNVSHDFRSPLTSIRGYIEAMKDGTIPVEDQEKYFDILLYETDRLTKLTSNLLQLNNIDDNGLLLHITTFDINDMIRKIALTFEGTVKKKHLTLNLRFSQHESFVEADSERIQQVIYNLLDNAIKFSNVDSSIDITTEEKGRKVAVYIKDHGVGIPKQSINKIWDRFYKSDSSRGRDKKGSGLGLSIVQEIMKAHKQNISVVSTEGVGTEFMFTLKSAE